MTHYLIRINDEQRVILASALKSMIERATYAQDTYEAELLHDMLYDTQSEHGLIADEDNGLNDFTA